MRISGRVPVLLILSVLVILPGSLARATVVERVTLPEMVRRSASIVHGVVQSVRTESEAGGARIYTYVTLGVGECLKGGAKSGDLVTFRQLGGQVGDQVVYVAGTPRFHQKQDVLVFLTGDDAGGFPQVMGIFQGAFRPGIGPQGESRVEGVAPDAVTSLLPGRTQPQSGATASPAGGSFPDFLQRIRDLVQEEKESSHP
jgi:hypothetical protein